ncbi:Hyalin [Holothuria leucospilota]|uniref:Hyalin n=1 Tax=Holothuria leucospilota TaxID=206669 RepID=A0A9Q1HHP2_HOLLE|nr:Hyalin [Holothuria leucospilota]
MNRFKDKSAGKIFNIMDFAVVFLLLFEGVSLVDTQTVLCPEDLVVAAQPGKAYADVEWREPSISAPQILTYKSHCPGRLPLGTMDVSYEYSEYFASLMDVSVIGSCSFTVNVMAADSEPPVVRDCPSSPQSRTFEAGIGNLVVTWTEPSATDNSGQVELVESTARSGKEFYLGGSKRFPVTYTFQDPTGNRAYCYFEIEFKAVDTTPPNIMRCPDPLVQEVPLDVTGAFVPWSFPSVTDNSGQFTLTTDPVVPDNFFSLGTHQITFNFTDPSGNYAICVTSVQVVARDLTPPEIIHCPSSIVIGVPPGVGTAEVDWLQPEATDDSGTVLLEFQSSPPGIYDVDTTLEVIYVFRDLASNEAVCRFSVRVIEDEVPPTIFGCPTEGIERFINSGQIEKEVFWEEPFGLDETSAEIVYQSHYPGDVFIQGNTTVEYIFEDSTDNSASCTFNVIVTVTENDPLGTPSYRSFSSPTRPCNIKSTRR